MKRKILLLFLSFSFLTSIMGQEMFTNNSNLLVNNNLNSGLPVAVCDLDQDGLDDIIRLEDSDILEIEYQQADGSFERFLYGNLGLSKEFTLVMADVDENGFLDIFSGGAYNKLKLLKGTGRTEFTLSHLSGPEIFLQNANFVDIDNDGEIDLFACHDEGISSVYKNEGGDFTYDLSVLNPVSTIPSDDSGNYGSIWADYDNDGDIDLYISKCRFNVLDTLDGRRVNLLFRNDGEDGFKEVAEEANLRPYAQSWASAFEDIDNDGDLDLFVVNHDKISMLYENEGDGTFKDITEEAGLLPDLNEIGFGLQVVMRDYDNDTYVAVSYTHLTLPTTSRV